MTTTGPNTFIVGGAKCGTTSMYSYLRDHPDVFMSDVKEPGFFAPDLPWQPAGRAVLDPEAYTELFARAGSATVRGEASVAYLRSQVAAARIRAAQPDARIIVMLRDPLAVIRSLHDFVRYLGLQPEADLATALAVDPATVGERWLLDYRSVADFAPQLQRYVDAFPREQIHVVVHDDLTRDVESEWRRVLEFLGLDPAAKVELRRENVTRGVRIPQLQRQLLAPSKAVQTVARAVVPQRFRRQLRRRGLNLNSVPVDRVPLDPELAAALAAELAPGVRRLEEMIGRDLSGWTAPRS